MGHGNAAQRLGQLHWLRSHPLVLYWGDLDVPGLRILARLLIATGQRIEQEYLPFS